MQVGAERILEIVLSLLSLRNVSQLDEFDLKTVDIHDGIDHAIRILQHRLRAEGNRPEIRVIRDYGQLPQVTCYASQMNQVFLHLLSNAIDAIASCFANDTLDERSEPRCITIRTETGSTQASATSSTAEPTASNPQRTTDCVFIRIADNGCGMSEAVQQKMFDPFFTTKPLGNAKGLGLSISYQIVVERHHGQLTCHSVVGEGTEFAIVLPIVVSSDQ
jgi:signal transduction histidine kinase